jgi:hypothetical protein
VEGESSLVESLQGLATCLREFLSRTGECQVAGSNNDFCKYRRYTEPIVYIVIGTLVMSPSIRTSNGNKDIWTAVTPQDGLRQLILLLSVRSVFGVRRFIWRLFRACYGNRLAGHLPETSSTANECKNIDGISLTMFNDALVVQQA